MGVKWFSRSGFAYRGRMKWWHCRLLEVGSRYGICTNTIVHAGYGRCVTSIACVSRWTSLSACTPSEHSKLLTSWRPGWYSMVKMDHCVEPIHMSAWTHACHCPTIVLWFLRTKSPFIDWPWQWQSDGELCQMEKFNVDHWQFTTGPAVSKFTFDHLLIRLQIIILSGSYWPIRRVLVCRSLWTSS